MNMMIQNVLRKFAKVFLTALAAMVVAMLGQLVTDYKPDGQAQTMIWNAVVLPVLVALIAAVKRMLQYDATKDQGR